MLTSFHLQNFKSFKQDAVLPLASLTVLIGANAAGKSNALEGLRFLSWLAQGNKLSAIQHAVNQADKVVRGRIPDIFQKGAELLELNINECVGIEDSSAGIDAINDAGIFSIGIGDKEILGKADVVLKSTKLLSLDFINGL